MIEGAVPDMAGRVHHAFAVGSPGDGSCGEAFRLVADDLGDQLVAATDVPVDGGGGDVESIVVVVVISSTTGTASGIIFGFITCIVGNSSFVILT